MSGFPPTGIRHEQAIRNGYQNSQSLLKQVLKTFVFIFLMLLCCGAVGFVVIAVISYFTYDQTKDPTNFLHNPKQVGWYCLVYVFVGSFAITFGTTVWLIIARMVQSSEDCQFPLLPDMADEPDSLLNAVQVIRK